ncbi:SufD family Fe-S cluster assembly protein [Rhodovulum strictum]|nr:SufD family Fe-S cluster assembly protein [Rhodovulum strictum]
MDDMTTSSGTLTNAERDILHEVGFGDESTRAGTSILADRAMRMALSNDPGVEILPLAQALKTYDFVQGLMFGLVDPEENEHVRLVAEHMHDPLGHFIWVKPGARVKLPVQSFTLLETPQGRQFTHDITLIDEGAEVEMISGSAVPASVRKGRHISIGETYIRANATCRSVTIEHWGPEMEVHSYGWSRMEAGATSTATAIMMSPIRHHASHSVSILDAGASATSQAVVFAPEGTSRVLASETRLIAPGARSQDVTRMVSAGGVIENRALLVGAAAGTEGFLGCDGLKLTDAGEIRAVPSLSALAEGTQLSHEASVGRIDGEKLAYLMASGMSEDAARDLIVQGFLSLSDDQIPAPLRARVAAMVAEAKSGGM